MPRGRRPGANVEDAMVPTVDNVPFKRPYKSKLKAKWRRIKNLKATKTAIKQTSVEPKHSYTFIAASEPFTRVKPKYCDLTGFEAKYCDPKTHLYYYSQHEYAKIHDLTRSAITALLALRGADYQHVAML